MDKRGADLIFQVISARYERGATIITNTVPIGVGYRKPYRVARGGLFARPARQQAPHRRLAGSTGGGYTATNRPETTPRFSNPWDIPSCSGLFL